MPMPEPIGEPSGMTAAQPTSASLRQLTGSSLQYGSTVKPSLTSSSAAWTSCSTSGYRVSRSPISSSLTQSVSTASRASCAVSTASRAVVQPAVLGSSRHRPAIRSTRLSGAPDRSIRRIEAVTSSAPLAAIASIITCRFGYPAEPISSREAKSAPAMVRGSDMARSSWSDVAAGGSAADPRLDDLDPIARLELGRWPGAPRHHGVVERDRDPARRAVGPLGDQLSQRGLLERHRRAVDDDLLVHAVLRSATRSAPAPPAKRSIVKSRMVSGTPPLRIASLIASAVIGVSRMPLRWWPVATNRPAIGVGPRTGNHRNGILLTPIT